MEEVVEINGEQSNDGSVSWRSSEWTVDSKGRG
jgi:hypothetical protein